MDVEAERGTAGPTHSTHPHTLQRSSNQQGFFHSQLPAHKAALRRWEMANQTGKVSCQGTFHSCLQCESAHAHWPAERQEAQKRSLLRRRPCLPLVLHPICLLHASFGRVRHVALLADVVVVRLMRHIDRIWSILEACLPMARRRLSSPRAAGPQKPNSSETYTSLLLASAHVSRTSSFQLSDFSFAALAPFICRQAKEGISGSFCSPTATKP